MKCLYLQGKMWVQTPVRYLVIGILLFGFVDLLHKVWQTIPFHRV